MAGAVTPTSGNDDDIAGEGRSPAGDRIPFASTLPNIATVPAVVQTSGLHADHATRRASAADILGYKPFVDGLRAISILSVVAYHLRIPGVTGEFIGVDVFFVISGYLIINQILGALEKEKFGFGEFWARRVLRILPPYFLVIAVCLAVAPLSLATPQEFAAFGREVSASSAMLINHHLFARQGYFDAPAETRPLLHMWTLAVEEQFYLVAPLILVGVWWLGRRLGWSARAFAEAALGVVVVGSLLACIAYTDIETNPAFYLMPFRAWEFALGGLVPIAIPALRRIPAAAGAGIAVVGLAMIGGAIFFMTGENFPSYRALLPVFGACLILAACLAFPQNLVARILSIRSLVWIGLISYAWYLWHWPLLTFMRIRNFGDAIPAMDGLAVAVSFILAAVTYHGLEAPLKRWRQRPRTAFAAWGIVAGGLAGAVIFFLLGIVYAQVIAPAVERTIPPTMSVKADRKPIRGDACAVDSPGFAPEDCMARAAGKPVGFLIGNSHARMIYQATRDAADASGAELITLWEPGCKPYYPVEATPPLPLSACEDWFTDGLETLARTLGETEPDFAIFSVDWVRKNVVPDESSGNLRERLLDLGISDPPSADFVHNLGIGLYLTIAKLNELGTKQILIVGATPDFDRVAPSCLLHADLQGKDRDICGSTRGEFEDFRRRAMITLAFVARQFPNVRLAEPVEAFCDRERCRPHDGDVLYFVDSHHLSGYGATRLLSVLSEDFLWAFTGEPLAESGPGSAGRASGP